MTRADGPGAQPRETPSRRCSDRAREPSFLVRTHAGSSVRPFGLAALARLDAEGAGALSIRGTAAALGVRPNALYTNVEDRAALERALVEELLGRADVSQLDGPAAQWRERILGFTTALRLALLRHPAAASLFMTAPMNGPNALAVGEGLVVALEDGGLAADAAAQGAYVLIVFVLGSVALEVAETDGRPPLPPEKIRIEERLSALGGVDPCVFPRTAETVAVAAGWISSAQFTGGSTGSLTGSPGCRSRHDQYRFANRVGAVTPRSSG